MTHKLQDLSQFAQGHPPREPFEEKGATALVYQHPHVRWRIAREETPDIGYGLWREDELGNAGISGAEEDAKAFAEELYKALADQLSIRGLDRLAEVFARERDAARKSRDEFAAKFRPGNAL